MSLVEDGLAVTEINDLIAFKVSEALKKGEIFQSLDLANDICLELKERGLFDIAARTFINSVILDICRNT